MLRSHFLPRTERTCHRNKAHWCLEGEAGAGRGGSRSHRRREHLGRNQLLCTGEGASLTKPLPFQHVGTRVAQPEPRLAPAVSPPLWNEEDVTKIETFSRCLCQVGSSAPSAIPSPPAGASPGFPGEKSPLVPSWQAERKRQNLRELQMRTAGKWGERGRTGTTLKRVILAALRGNPWPVWDVPVGVSLCTAMSLCERLRRPRVPCAQQDSGIRAALCTLQSAAGIWVVAQNQKNTSFSTFPKYVNSQKILCV